MFKQKTPTTWHWKDHGDGMKWSPQTFHNKTKSTIGNQLVTSHINIGNIGIYQ